MADRTEPIAAAARAVRQRLEEAASRAGRLPSEVSLIAVTKGVPPDRILAAVRSGLHDLGENYARDLAAKRDVVLRAGPPGPTPRWHFIGKVQRGTASLVALHSDVVHSAEPGRALLALARRAELGGSVLPCLAQVDFTGGRQGVAPRDVPRFLEEAATLAGIRMIGLMTVPPPGGGPDAARPFFARLRELRDEARRSFPDVAELSMGMSSDYEVAVEEGATMLRVGTALFGPRPAAPRRAPR